MMPRAGLDLRYLPDEPVPELLEAAIALGWRFFCVQPGSRTAVALGRAVRESGRPRTEFFLITFLSAALGTYSAASAEVQFEISLLGQFLDTAVVDAEGLSVVVPQDVEELWRVMEKAMAQGKVRSFGVHGFSAPQVESLCGDMALAPQLLLAARQDQEEDLLRCAEYYRMRLLTPCTDTDAAEFLDRGAAVLIQPPEESPARWLRDLQLPEV